MTKCEWHIHQQDFFYDEYNEKHIGKYICDTVYKNIAIEFQDKHYMSKEEVMNKEIYYKNSNYIPVWVLNMNNRIVVNDDGEVNYFDDYVCNYIECVNLYISYNKCIYKHGVCKCMKEYDFYDYIINNECLPHENLFTLNLKCKIYSLYPEIEYVQMGAGSGKTFSICNECMKFEHENIIILTKVNSAKDEIMNKFFEVRDYVGDIDLIMNELCIKDFKECINLINGLKFYNFSIQKCENDFEVNDFSWIASFDFHAKNNEVTNVMNNVLKNDTPHCNEITNILITTIDSFIYHLYGGKNLSKIVSKNIFAKAAEDMKTINPSDTFKHIKLKNALIIIDEAQDISGEYLNAFKLVYKYIKGIKIRLVGDILQSLYSVMEFDSTGNKTLNSLYYKILRNADSTFKAKQLHSTEPYICRRFVNLANMYFVNQCIHDNDEFKNMMSKYELNHIITHMDNIREDILNIKPESHKYNITIDSVEQRILDDRELKTSIIKCLKSLANSSPNDWLVVTPMVKNVIVLNRVVDIINSYWETNIHWHENVKTNNKYWKDINTKNKCIYSRLFHSENGEPIDVKPYKHLTHILSTHAAKGMTYKYVIAFNCQFDIIKYFPQCEFKKNLFYYSVLNVAYTRQTDRLFVLELDKESSGINLYPGIDKMLTQDVIETLYKKCSKCSWFESFNEFAETSSRKNDLIDNNFQVARYHTIKANVWLVPVVNDKNKDDIIVEAYQAKAILYSFPKYYKCTEIVHSYERFYSICAHNDKIINEYKNICKRENNPNLPFPEEKKLVFPIRGFKEDYKNEVNFIKEYIEELIHSNDVCATIRNIYENIYDNKHILNVITTPMIMFMKRYIKLPSEYVTLLDTLHAFMTCKDFEKTENKLVTYMIQVYNFTRDLFSSTNENDYYNDISYMMCDGNVLYNDINLTCTLNHRLLMYPKDKYIEQRNIKRGCNLVIANPLNGCLNPLNKCETYVTTLILSRMIESFFERDDIKIWVPTLNTDEFLYEDRKLIFDFTELNKEDLKEIDACIMKRLKEISIENNKQFVKILKSVCKLLDKDCETDSTYDENMENNVSTASECERELYLEFNINDLNEGYDKYSIVKVLKNCNKYVDIYSKIIKKDRSVYNILRKTHNRQESFFKHMNKYLDEYVNSKI